MLYCQSTLLEIFPRLFSFHQTYYKEDLVGLTLDPFPIYAYFISLIPKHPSALLSIGLLVFKRSEELESSISKLLNVIQQLIHSANSKYLYFFTVFFLLLELKDLFGVGTFISLYISEFRRRSLDNNVFICLVLVVRALKMKIEQQMRDLLPLLFSTSLSKGYD